MFNVTVKIFYKFVLNLFSLKSKNLDTMLFEFLEIFTVYACIIYNTQLFYGSIENPELKLTSIRNLKFLYFVLYDKYFG